jgi:hypothetical protein
MVVSSPWLLVGTKWKFFLRDHKPGLNCFPQSPRKHKHTIRVNLKNSEKTTEFVRMAVNIPTQSSDVKYDNFKGIKSKKELQ